MLLNSNKVKGIDTDLLLIQQKRKLFKQLNEMEFQTRNNKILFQKNLVLMKRNLPKKLSTKQNVNPKEKSFGQLLNNKKHTNVQTML